MSNKRKSRENQTSTFYTSNTNFTINTNINKYNNNIFNNKVNTKSTKPILNYDTKSNYSNSSIGSNNINNTSNSSIKLLLNTLEGKNKIDNISNNKPKQKIQNNKDNKKLSILFKQKIESAKINEEIVLPNEEIELETFTIKNPIKIKGQTNSVLYIKDGPILIDCTNNNKNFVKFSQLRIIYTDNNLNKEKKITTLFKIYPSSYLELEDCDIVYNTKKNEIISQGLPKPTEANKNKKSVAFLHFSNKTSENNKNIFPSILNLTNTRINNFFQSIRAGQNCIININKSAFVQNYGKAIVMINPLFLKIAESYFENNGDNCIHIKFIEDCLYEEKRKLFFNKNEFNYTLGNNICIEGLKNNKLDLSIVINKNNFINSIINGVLIFDILYNYFEINENIFKKNNGNGLYIQKAFYNEINNNIIKDNSSNKQIKIKNNKFIENKGFGLFINDCIIELISNKFSLNRQSGMFLGDILIEEPKKGIGDINLEKINLNNEINNTNNKCIIIKNSFYENEANGLHIYGYPYQIFISESIFSSNCQNGIALYSKEDININKKLDEFIKSKININMANIILNKCIIEKNMKNGIFLNYGFIFCEESFIVNNIDYAIFTKKKEYQNCFKEGKKCEISGSLGGNWGEINMNKVTSCGFSCMPNKGENLNFKLKEEIVKNVPKLNDSFDDNISTMIYNEIKDENKNKKITKDDRDNNCKIF